MKILHVFADIGIESSELDRYGNVVRIGINPKDSEYTETIKADARELPIKESVQFDLGFFQPPCGRWSEMTSISGDNDSWPNYIPLSRELADMYCNDYIIENKPAAPLENPVILAGKQFGIPIVYKRGFETSFSIGSVPSNTNLETECSPYFYSDRSKEWWSLVKGYSNEFGKEHLAKNCVPVCFLRFLLRQYRNSRDERDSDYARSNHSDQEPDRLQKDTEDQLTYQDLSIEERELIEKYPAKSVEEIRELKRNKTT